eukprot:2080670-Rhodomonas_salina.1
MSDPDLTSRAPRVSAAPRAGRFEQRPGQRLPAYGRATQCPVDWEDSAEQVTSASCLRSCYAMSGTEIGYGAIGLRACYAMSVLR